MIEDGGRLLPDWAVAKLAEIQRRTPPWNAKIIEGWAKRQAEDAARPWHVKMRRAVRLWTRTWEWRIADAWAHLRGRPCSDSQS